MFLQQQSLHKPSSTPYRTSSVALCTNGSFRSRPTHKRGNGRNGTRQNLLSTTLNGYRKAYETQPWPLLALPPTPLGGTLTSSGPTTWYARGTPIQNAARNASG